MTGVERQHDVGHTHAHTKNTKQRHIPSSDSGSDWDHAPESTCEQTTLSVIPRTVTSPDARKRRERGSEFQKQNKIIIIMTIQDEDIVRGGGLMWGWERRSTSSTGLRSCRADRSTAGRLQRRAWCLTRRSSGCTRRWGRNECRKSNSSTSHHDSRESRTKWEAKSNKPTVIQISVCRVENMRRLKVLHTGQ